jgi:hypothetical protein
MPNETKKYRNKLNKLGVKSDFGAGSKDTAHDLHVDFNSSFDYAAANTITDLTIREIDVSKSVTILSSSTNHIAVALPKTSTTGRIHTIFVDNFPDGFTLGGVGVVLSGANTTLAKNATRPNHQFLHSGSGATCRFNGSLWSVILHGSGSQIA